MSVLLLTEGPTICRLQALFARARRSARSRAVSLDGAAYAPAAWAAAIAEAAAGAEAHRRCGLRPRQRVARARRGTARRAVRSERHRGRRRCPSRASAAARTSSKRRDCTARRRSSASHRTRSLRLRQYRSRRSWRQTTARHASSSGRGERRRRLARDAKVVVSGGRGVGSAEGFAIIEELAAAPRRRGRVQPRRHERRLAPAHRPGRPDRHEDLRRPLHRLRHQWRDAAHRRRERREEDPRDQQRPGGADPRRRRLRRDRRPARDRPRDQRRAEKGARGIASSPRLRSPSLLVACGGLFARRARFLTAAGAPRAPERPRARHPGQLRNEATIVLGQRKLLDRLVPGLMHAFIFWGFLVLFPTIVMATIAAVDPHATLPWLGHQGWYVLLVDLFVILVFAGVVAAAVPRARPAEALRRLASRRGVRDPRPDRRRRADAPLLARRRDRVRPQRVARALVVPLERARAGLPVEHRRGAHLRLGAPLRLILGFLATCRTRSTCTSPPPR